VPTSAEYGARVAQARAFLEGAGAGERDGGDDVTGKLLRDMQSASDALEFERAAVLRDKLRRLTELRERFARLRFAVESLTFTYHVPGVDGDDRVYLIRRGVVRECLPSPRDENENRALADSIQRQLFGARPSRTMSLPLHEIDELLVVAAWFRAHPSEMERTKVWS
jgi:excinuclease ABC subunit C